MTFAANNRKGFSRNGFLIFILVVGMVSGIVIMAIQTIRIQARNNERLDDMRRIKLGIQMYYDKFGTFPPASSDCCQGWDQSPCSGDPSRQFIEALQLSGISANAADPGGIPRGANDCLYYGYAYRVYDSGEEGCDPSRGRFYVLGARNFETSDNPQPESPGFSCGMRNWQDEFEWVTGAFENDFKRVTQ